MTYGNLLIILFKQKMFQEIENNSEGKKEV